MTSCPPCIRGLESSRLLSDRDGQRKIRTSTAVVYYPQIIVAPSGCKVLRRPFSDEFHTPVTGADICRQLLSIAGPEYELSYLVAGEITGYRRGRSPTGESDPGLRKSIGNKDGGYKDRDRKKDKGFFHFFRFPPKAKGHGWSQRGAFMIRANCSSSVALEQDVN
jgi:hypothetical protein